MTSSVPPAVDQWGSCAVLRPRSPGGISAPPLLARSYVWRAAPAVRASQPALPDRGRARHAPRKLPLAKTGSLHSCGKQRHLQHRLRCKGKLAAVLPRKMVMPEVVHYGAHGWPPSAPASSLIAAVLALGQGGPRPPSDSASPASAVRRLPPEPTATAALVHPAARVRLRHPPTGARPHDGASQGDRGRETDHLGRPRAARRTGAGAAGCRPAVSGRTRPAGARRRTRECSATHRAGGPA